MLDDSEGNDPRKVWQDQGTEKTDITLQKIREKARRLQQKSRLELTIQITAAVFVIVASIVGIGRAHGAGLRVVFALAIAWVVAGQVFLHRGMWPPRMPGNLALSTGVEFYRGEIKRRSSLVRRIFQVTFGPIVLCTVGWIVAITGIAWGAGLSGVQVLPFSTLFAIWIVGMFVQRWRRQRDLQRELAWLDDLEQGK